MCVTLGILVEDNVTVILDELAGRIDAVDLGPTSGTALELNATLSKAFSESIRCLPAVSQENDS